MAKPRPIPGIGPDLPMREAAARTIAVRTDEVFSFADAVLDTSDIERVHDMRVATRRLRAALEVFRPCFPKPELKWALREVKALADALGERRDPDVALAFVEEVRTHLPPRAGAGVELFEDDLRSDQQAGNRALAEELRRVRTGRLQARLLELAQAARA